MMHQLISFGSGLLAFIFYVIAFLILMRFRGGLSWLHLEFLVGLGTHVLSSIVFFYMIPGFLYWYALGVFSVAWVAFFVFSTAIYVSISALILRTIDEQPNRSKSIDDIYNECIKKPFQFRASFFIQTGLIELCDDKYQVTDKGRKAAEKILSLREFLGMQEGCGLYDSGN